MARSSKKQFDMSDLNTIDLGKEMGLTILSDTNKADIKNILPTRVPQYDRIMGGGIPLGRLTEVYGIPGSGKSTFAVHLTKTLIDLGIITVWVDTEGTADNARMEQLGVDITKIFSIQAGEGQRLKNTVELSIEQVGKELEHWVDTFNEKYPGVPIVFIWDSLGATRSQIEIDGGIDTKQIGIRAAATQKVINAVTPKLNNTNTGIIVVNQARDDLDAGMYGDKVKSGGGKAFEHSASLRLKVNKGAKVKQYKDTAGKEEYSGHSMRLETKKSKLSRPDQKASADLLSEWDLPTGEVINGLDPEYTIYQEAVEKGFITKGAWRNYVTLNGEEIKLRDAEWTPRLKEDPELFEELFKRTYVANFPKGYAPLKNKDVDITTIPEYKTLKEYYDELEKEKPKEETKGEQEDQ